MNPQYLLYYVNFLLYMGYSLVAPVIPKIIVEKGGNSFISGLFLGTFSLSQLVAIIYCPQIIDFFGRKKFFIVSTSIQTLAIFLYSILKNLNGFFFFFISFSVRAIHGFSDGSLATSMYGTTNIISKGPDLGRILGKLEFIGSMGGAIGPLIISIFYSIGGYTLPFIITTFLSFLCVIGFIYIDFGIHQQIDSDKNNSNKSIFPYMKNKNVILILLAGMCNFNSGLFYFPTLTNYLGKVFGISVEVCSIIFTMPLVSYWISLLFVNGIMDIIGNKLSFTIGLIFPTIGCLLIAPLPILPHSVITIIVGLLVQGYGQPFINIPFLLELNFYLNQDYGLTENEYGDISGSLYCLAFNIGSMVSTPVAGYITHKSNFENSAYFTSFLCFLMILYYYKSYKEIIDGKLSELLNKNKEKNSENIKLELINRL